MKYYKQNGEEYSFSKKPEFNIKSQMTDKEKQRELIVEIMKADEQSGLYDEPIEQTAIQQAIAMVRKRIESQNNTLMGKHTAHHLQQVERELYDLLEEEKGQMECAYEENNLFYSPFENFNEYYKVHYQQ